MGKLIQTLGYARVSTDDQDLSLQRDALTKYGCDRIFEEYGSGGKMDRPVWKNLIRARRKGDTIVVWKIDRLGRTLTGVLEAVEDMEREGVNFVTLDGKIDTQSAMGKAFFRMALIFAELERDLISERTKAGMAVAKARGSQFGPPSLIRDDPLRLAEARLIVEEGLENITAQAAVDRLNRANRKAKPIKALETWRRWVRDGCPGADD